jgi:hypothetical protein
MTVEHVALNRYKLHKLLWSQGLGGAAKALGFTPNALRAACATLHVPIPTPQFLLRQRAGQPVKRDRLPRWTGAADMRFAHVRRPSGPSASSQPKVSAIPVRQVVESGSLKWPPPAPRHPLRQALINGLHQGAIDSRGWHVCLQPGLIRMTLSEASSRDGLSVVESLFDALSEAGFAPKSDANALSPAYVDVYGMQLTFELFERSSGRLEHSRHDIVSVLKVPRQSGRGTYIPTGLLELAIRRKGGGKALLIARARNAALLKKRVPWLVLRLPECVRRARPATTPALISGNELISVHSLTSRDVKEHLSQSGYPLT